MTDFTIDPNAYSIELASCACGCGEPAPVARRSCPRQGVRRGDQLRYVSGHNQRVAPDLSRFVITSAGCHEWTGPRGKKGYGRIQVTGVHRHAHAVVWEQAHGPVPPGMHVDHECHNPPCMRLEHLRLLSPVGNNRAKSCPLKLTADQVTTIRTSTVPSRKLAATFGVSASYVRDIRCGGRTGGHDVKGPYPGDAS